MSCFYIALVNALHILSLSNRAIVPLNSLGSDPAYLLKTAKVFAELQMLGKSGKSPMGTSP